MHGELRDTGISVIGHVPCGTHLSLFYDTRTDLVETIVPFLAAGLRNHELCVWVPSDPTTEDLVKAAFRKEIPDLDDHFARGEIEFAGRVEWYGREGCFEVDAVIQKWRDTLERADRNRFSGVRGSGELSWLKRSDLTVFYQYEHAMHKFLLGQPMLVLCTYPLETNRATDVFDTARAHHFAIARRGGDWDVVETPEIAASKSAIQRLNEELEERVAERTSQLARANEELLRTYTHLEEAQELSHTGSFAWDAATLRPTFWSHENFLIFGFDPEGTPPSLEEVTRRVHPADRARFEAKVKALREGQRIELEFRVVHPDGTIRHVNKVARPILDAAGRTVEVIGTAIDITERKRAAATLLRVKRAARERAMTARFEAILQERSRLAGEIHDTLLQGVTGIAAQLRAVLPRLASDPPAANTIRGIAEVAESTIRDARQAVWDMRVPAVIAHGLGRAIEEEVRATAGGLATVSIDGTPGALTPAVEDTLFRVAREAVVNAVRHADATRISVRLSYGPRGVSLTVKDDGRGFHVDPVIRAHGGRWGLLGMRERAERIGASLSVESTRDVGTNVELRIPSFAYRQEVRGPRGSDRAI